MCPDDMFCMFHVYNKCEAVAQCFSSCHVHVCTYGLLMSPGWSDLGWSHRNTLSLSWLLSSEIKKSMTCMRIWLVTPLYCPGSTVMQSTGRESDNVTAFHNMVVYCAR